MNNVDPHLLIGAAALLVAIGAGWGLVALVRHLAGYDHRCPDCEMPRDLCECDA